MTNPRLTLQICMMINIIELFIFLWKTRRLSVHLQSFRSVSPQIYQCYDTEISVWKHFWADMNLREV